MLGVMTGNTNKKNSFGVYGYSKRWWSFSSRVEGRVCGWWGGV